MKVSVSRAIEGISINGDEHLLDDDGNLMVFESQEVAEEFLRENGFTDEMLESINYNEVEED